MALTPADLRIGQIIKGHIVKSVKEVVVLGQPGIIITFMNGSTLDLEAWDTPIPGTRSRRK